MLRRKAIKKRSIAIILVLLLLPLTILAAIKIISVSAASETVYLKQTDAKDGVYAIVFQSTTGATPDRIMMASDNATTSDQTLFYYENNSQVVLNSNYGANNQLWNLKSSDDGWTLQNKATNKYLDLTNLGNSNFAKTNLSDTPYYLDITKQDDGFYICSKTTEKRCLEHNANEGQFHVAETASVMRFYAETTRNVDVEADPVNDKYLRETGDIDDTSNYVITAIDNYTTRILYHYRDGASDENQLLVDQLTFYSVATDELVAGEHDSDKFPLASQTWKITGDNTRGYTITAANGDQVKVSKELYDSCASRGTNESCVYAKAGNDGSRFTIEKNDDNTYYIYTTINNTKYYIYHAASTASSDGRKFIISTDPCKLSLFKKTEQGGEYAETNFSGTTTKQPFVGTSYGTKAFRIPGIITLDDGTIITSADVRWQDVKDSPRNIDTAVAVSMDNGENWRYQIVNYRGDYTNTQTSTNSSSTTDSALAYDGEKVYLAYDLTPPGVSVSTAKKGSTGFDSNGRLLVAKGTAGSAASETASDYKYYVDFSAVSGKTADGKNLYVIAPQTEYYVDADLNVYYAHGDEFKPSYIKQTGSDKYIQKNLAYYNSEWKIYPTFYNAVKTGTVSNGEISWSEPKLLNIKNSASEGFLGIAPGHGITVTTLDGKKRTLFVVYDNGDGTEYSSTIYTDDGGATWQRGEKAKQVSSAGKSSEGEIIKIDDETIRLYSRNTSDKIGYADSKDFGKTWGAYQLDDDLSYASNVMVSFINVDGTIYDKDGNKYDNLVAASYPITSGRKDGVVRIGNIGSDGKITWLNENKTNVGGSDNDNGFAYSDLTQLKSDDDILLGILYEGTTANNSIEFESVSLLSFVDGYTLEAPKVDIVYSAGDHGTFADIKYQQVRGETTKQPTEAELTHQNGWLFDGWQEVISDKVTGPASYTAKWKREQTSSTVKIVWDDDEDANSTRPTSLTLAFANQDDIVKKNIELNSNNSWTSTSDQLPTYKEDGSEKYTYDYALSAVEGYDIKKETDDKNISTFTLSLKEVKVSYKSGDHGDFADIEYVQKYGEAAKTPDADAIVAKNGYIFDKWSAEPASRLTTDVEYVASYTRETTSYKVEIKWDDQNSQSRPKSLKLRLMRNKVAQEEVELTENDAWAKTWDNLPTYSEDSAEAYAYSIELADTLGDYTSSLETSAAEGILTLSLKQQDAPTVDDDTPKDVDAPAADKDASSETGTPAEQSQNTDLPSTLDNLLKYLLIGMGSLAGLAAAIFICRR